jgi:hypothetical protein
VPRECNIVRTNAIKRSYLLILRPFAHYLQICNSIPNHDMSRDSRSPTVTADALPPKIMDIAAPTTKTSIANMQTGIEGLLEGETRRVFKNSVNNIMRLGNHKPKALEPRRQKIREIVTENPQVMQLYKVYAAAQRAIEKRTTFQLPVVDIPKPEGKSGMPTATETKHIKEVGRIVGEQEIHEPRVQVGMDGESNGTPGMQEGVLELKAHAELEKSSNLPEVGTADTFVQAAHSNGTEIRQESYDVIDQQLEPAQEEDTEMEEADPGAAETALAQGLNNYLPGAVDIMQTTHNKAANQSEHLIDRTNTPRQNAAPNMAVEINSGEQIDQLITDSLLERHHYVTPVENPKAFPIGRVQSVQAEYHPWATVVNMCTHRDADGVVVRVTADLQDGPVNHFVIDDARIITGLGLLEGGCDTISLNNDCFRPDETFTFDIIHGQRVKNLDAFVIGRFRPARHAYLYWLDSHRSADPKHAPYFGKARILAPKLSRRAFDVWGEIDRYWTYLKGSGRKARQNRLRYLVKIRCMMRP